jgi:hypothetical protein
VEQGQSAQPENGWHVVYGTSIGRRRIQDGVAVEFERDTKKAHEAFKKKLREHVRDADVQFGEFGREYARNMRTGRYVEMTWGPSKAKVTESGE